MRAVPFQTKLNSNNYTISTLWMITRKDGVIMRFTDYDRDLNVPGVGVFKSSIGFKRTSIAFTCEGKTDNLDIEGILDDESIAEADLQLGKYDFALLSIAAVDAEDPSSLYLLAQGRLGEVTYDLGSFNVQIDSLAEAYSQKYGEMFAPECAARLGDTRCKVNIAPGSAYRISNAVVSALPGEGTIATTAILSSNFTNGVLIWTTGANATVPMEVRVVSEDEASGGWRVHLFLPSPAQIQVGDRFDIVMGCDGLLGTCRDRFNNVANFRGFPHLPGQDKILQRGWNR